MSSAPALSPTASSILVRIFNGARRIMDPPLNILFSVTNNFTVFNSPSGFIFRNSRQTSTLPLDIPQVFDTPEKDDYTITAFASGFHQTGYRPVRAKAGKTINLDLMMLPENPKFNFSMAAWEFMKLRLPFLASGAADDAAARARYENLMATKPLSLLSLLNLTTAMAQIPLRNGNPNQYIKQIIWDDTLAQDRFFCFCDPQLKIDVKAAADEGQFDEEPNPGAFHPGATASWKQNQFDVTNVQLTFHENPADQKVIDGVNCIKLEPDIDLFKDVIEHGLGEVIPNALTGGKTDPVAVCSMRWIAGQLDGKQEFEPPYTIE